MAVATDQQQSLDWVYAIFLSDRCKRHQVVDLDVLFGMPASKTAKTA